MGAIKSISTIASLFLGGTALLFASAAYAAEPCQGNTTDDEMVRVGSICVDKYEASVWSDPAGMDKEYGAKKDDYPDSFPDNGNWSAKLYAVSKKDTTPSRYITWFQAQQACAASGKRLLTNAEWQMAAIGTPDPNKDDGKSDCAIASLKQPVKTGSRAKCVSNWGVRDMVGNLGEWVSNWGHSGDTPWAPSEHADNNTAMYGEDYTVEVQASHIQEHSKYFPSAWIRGGSYQDGKGAGVYAIDMSRAPSDNSHINGNVGFRCAR